VRRRRELTSSSPPPELVAYDPAVWAPRVDPAAYAPNRYRNFVHHRPVGEPRLSFEQWHRSTAERLWLRARMAWAREHGWPDGKTGLDLLREFVQQRRTPDPAPQARRATLSRASR
jgi:hypothetical protein